MKSESESSESLYVGWCLANSGRGAEAFERFCAEHPSHEGELRLMHSGMKGVEELLGPGPVVEGWEWGEGDQAFDALVERLRSRRSLESRYELIGEIGRGGMGCVLEQFDMDLRRPVAKKVMLVGNQVPKEAASGTTRLGRFCEEAQITAQLTHPGVVSVHELGIDDSDQVFFTMDLVKGKTLREVFEQVRVGENQWTLTRAVGVLERVCETLAYAHSRGVIHRDVKPENVMVGSFGEVYTLDWGLAKLIEGSAERLEVDASSEPVSSDRRDATDSAESVGIGTMPGVVAGTLGFISPEQARGEVDALDARTDVYSMGAMLYMLLTGVRPYFDQAETKKGGSAPILAMGDGSFTPIKDLAPHAAPELVSIAERAMSTDVADRYDDAQGMALDLRAWLEGCVVSAYEQGAWAQLRKWVKRNRGMAAALLMAVLAITGGATGMAIFERNGRLGIERQRLISRVKGAPTQLSGLLAEAESLWPAMPENAPAMKRWLEQREVLESNRPLIAEAVKALQGADSFFAADEFGSQSLPGLIGVQEKGTDLQRAAEWLEQRIDTAGLVEEWAGTGAQRWALALESIASSDRYGGMEMTRQAGLVPLREDPRSGLWEFWHLLSGAEPVLDPDADTWRVEGDTGLVLVLIPAGSGELGTHIERPGHPLYDDAEDPGYPSSNPLHYPVTLDAFFLSKYELTQAQWGSVRSTNPSEFKSPSGVHPVEIASWDEFTVTLDRLDLSMPTEAQWEYAARGGSKTRFYTGQAPESLFGHGVIFPNIAGYGGVDLDDEGEVVNVFGLPYSGHPEPVGSLQPNPFGLHDVHGNVWEWCLDVYAYDAQLEPGNGLRISGEHIRERVMRGGSFSGTWVNARLGFRFDWQRQNGEPDVGVRPARALGF